MSNWIETGKRSRRWLLLVGLLAICSAAVADESRLIDLQREWGIEPVHLRISAGGYMIEFRYKILDTEKALIMSDRKDFPQLLSQKSKARLSVPYFPTVGYIKSNRRFIKLGKNYTAFFNNPGKHLLPGDRARIQIRDQISPELTLQ